MKRVLFFSPTGGHAGIDVCLETLVLGLDRQLIEPFVVFPPDAILKEKFEKNGICCYELPLIWWTPINFSGADLLNAIPGLRNRVEPLVEIIKKEKIDVVFSNTTVAFDGAIAAGICGVPHVLFVHAQYVKDIYREMPDETRDFLYDCFGKISDRVVCCSRLLHEFFSDYADNSCYIYNGVDTDMFSYRQRTQTDKSFPLKMICAGHYNANKQQDFALRALSIVQEKREDLYKRMSFTMVGDGEEEYKKALSQLIVENKLEGHAFMEDYREDIHRYLDRFTVYVNCSKTENLPVSVLEAMSCGMPILGTVNDGTVQTVQDGGNGFLCDTPEMMAEKMIFLAEHPEVIAQMSVSSREKAENQFSLKQYIEKFQTLLLRLERTARHSDRQRFFNGLYMSVREGYIPCLQKPIPMPAPDNLAVSGQIRRKRTYRVTCMCETVQRIGILFIVFSDAKGTCRIEIKKGGGLLLSSAEIPLQDIVKDNYTFFTLDRPVSGEYLNKFDVSIELRCSARAGHIEVFEDRRRRKFVYKVFNKLHLPLKGNDTLYVEMD